MEQINKHNYEAWFLAYYEGSLSAGQVADLLLFLELHPELLTEFESQELKLPKEPKEIVFPGKAKLKKPEISIENCEDFYLASLDGTLNKTQEEELQKFLISHPEQASDYRFYSMTKLQPEEGVVFPAKARIYKQVAFDPTSSETMVLAMDSRLTQSEQSSFNKTFAADAHVQKEYAAYLATKVQPDAQIVYPFKERLKRRKGIVWLPAYSYWAAAASIALLILTGIGTQIHKTEQAFINALKGQPSVVFQNKTLNGVNPISTEAFVSNLGSQAQKERVAKDKHPLPNEASRTTQAKVVLNQLDRTALTEFQSRPADTLLTAYSVELSPSQSVPVVPFVAPASVKPAELEFKGVKEYALEKLREKTGLPGTGAPHIPAGWALTRTAARAFNKVSGRKIHISERYDNNGQLVSYAIGSSSLAYEKTILKQE
jgi:hypothetical protein